MIKIAILGFGTVGQGVAEVLSRNAETITAHAEETIELKYILDIVDFPDSPFADKVIHDFSVIENDPEIRIVVETIGGQRVAYDYTRRALLAGKSVVTSNKELVAQHGTELLETAAAHNVSYLFEASSGGAIPIIRPLMLCLAANRIQEITGILNGTTNYILTRMHNDGVGLETALSEAQQKGYAEANPSADIEGLDACRKICILASLAFGQHVPPEKITTIGITGIETEDMACADRAGYAVKLLARAVLRQDGRVHLLVAPHLVPSGDPLFSVSGVFNGIKVIGDMAGELMFYGSGAGKLPTASAVAADIADIAGHIKTPRPVRWREADSEYLADTSDMIYRHYVRVSGADAKDVLAVFPQAEILEESADCVVFLTGPVATGTAEEGIERLCEGGAEKKALIRVLA